MLFILAVTLALASSSSSSSSSSGSSSSSSSSSSGHKTHLFHIERDFQPYNFVDANGDVQGFFVDLFTEVCHVAKKRCVFTVGAGSGCWDTSMGEHGLPGTDLHDNFVDACVGWTWTKERANSLAIIAQAIQSSSAVIAKLKSSGGADMSSAKIAFQEGWQASPAALAAAHPETATAEAHFYSTIDEMLAALRSGAVDYVFSLDTHFAAGYPDDVEMVENVLFEGTGGIGMMLSKRYAMDYSWVDNALKKVVRKGIYHDLCMTEYGGSLPKCYDSWDAMVAGAKANH